MQHTARGGATWFPIYLVQARGMTILQAGLVASLPAICGFSGGVLGGVLSDGMIRRGHSLTLARKVPIVGGIVTPIVIGYRVAKTGSFNGALVFVGLNALLTVFSYLVIVKD
ncbi:MAG: transporter, family, glucarate transporter, partial [Paraburkholderia sp.]|nr:transporter, family, glucarate transporter [Paraburkholderia sp.]